MVVLEVQMQAFLDGVIWLSLLTLPVRPEAELKASTQQILELRPDLLSTVLTMLIERFPTLTLEKIMEIATIPAKDLRHTRAAQQWIEEGRLEGEAQSRALGAANVPCACSTAAAAPSVMQPQPASRPCRYSSWKAWPRHCSISVAPAIWRLG